MENHISKYKRRAGRNGISVGESYENNTIAFIESTFNSSPTYRRMEVLSSEFPNILGIDARIVEVERLGSLYQVLFRPKEGLNVGSYVKFDDDVWLVSDVWGSTKHIQKAMVQKCNRVIKWRDRDGIIVEINSIASQSPIGSKSNQGKFDVEWNKFDVSLPKGQLFVYFEKNGKTSPVDINHRFIFGKNAYEVTGIDDTSYVDKNGYGIIQLVVKVTTKRDEDDFVNFIPFNKYGEISTSKPILGLDEEKDKGTGGMIW